MMMHPWELDLYTLADLLTKLKGFSDGKKERAREVRRLSFSSLSPWLPKGTTEERLWPIDEEDSADISYDEALALKQKFIDAGILHPVKQN